MKITFNEKKEKKRKKTAPKKKNNHEKIRLFYRDQTPHMKPSPTIFRHDCGPDSVL
jgi:hypothetical protein